MLNRKACQVRKGSACEDEVWTHTWLTVLLGGVALPFSVPRLRVDNLLDRIIRHLDGRPLWHRGRPIFAVSATVAFEVSDLSVQTIV